MAVFLRSKCEMYSNNPEEQVKQMYRAMITVDARATFFDSLKICYGSHMAEMQWKASE